MRSSIFTFVEQTSLNMKEIRRFETVSSYNEFNNNETLHPLVHVVDLAKASPREACSMYFGLFVVFLKESKCGDLRYGNTTYDYREGTLVFLSPGQVVRGDPSIGVYQPKGMALVFHPDLVLGTSLGQKMTKYTFFGYQSNEALHLSERERKMVLDCFSKIQEELERSIDRHSKRIIVSNIELLMNYCIRFYDRQFITREQANRGLLGKLEQLMSTYFKVDVAEQDGLPTVAYCAEQLHLSANYFGDLVKKETGMSAQEYLQRKIIEVAKSKMADPGKTVAIVAGELGFKYPQHFSRFFKQQTGCSPKEFRNTIFIGDNSPINDRTTASNLWGQ